MYASELGLAGAGAVASILTKRLRESSDMSGMSFSQQVNNSRKLVSGTEYGDSRRAKAYVQRLHPAKYLKCDPLLKEMFFPLMTIANRFGFCSTSGLGARSAALNAVQETPTDPVAYSKAAGIYRGIAMFTLRSTAVSDTSDFKLNATNHIVGKTKIDGSGDSIWSPYRRFNNGPIFLRTSGAKDREQQGATVATDSVPTVQFTGITSTQLDANVLAVSEVGNINRLETKAVHGAPFVHRIAANSALGHTSLPDDQSVDPNWNGTGSVVSNNNQYYANLKNTTIRIADGYLELDITNGKSVSCFIEIVIHAHKKHSKDTNTQTLMQAIYSAVEYQQKDPNIEVYNDTSYLRQQPGGWQAFWDPTYPLFGCKSQHRKPIDAIANEVHRSNHMLGPGQSKLVKIFLGNLYYDLGSKSEDGSYGTESLNYLGLANPSNGVGSLNIAIGHSGIEQLVAPSDPAGGTDAAPFSVLPDSYSGTESTTHIVGGTGFWVGKSFCPSEIVVNGNYVEKFYPSYLIDKERRNYSDKPLLPPATASSGDKGLYTLPTALPVTDVVGTVNAYSGAPSNISSQVRDLP